MKFTQLVSHASSTGSSIEIPPHCPLIALVGDLKSGQTTLNSLIPIPGLSVDWVHSIELDEPGPFVRKLSDPLLQPVKKALPFLRNKIVTVADGSFVGDERAEGDNKKKFIWTHINLRVQSLVNL